MNHYKSKKVVLLIIDMLAITISFLASFGLRSVVLSEKLGITYGLSTYALFLVYALILYGIICLVSKKLFVEKISVKELILKTVEHQIIFIAVFMILFFVLRKAALISRVFVGLFGLFNVAFCIFGRLLYRNYCIKKTLKQVGISDDSISRDDTAGDKVDKNHPRHVFIVGAKSIGLYGGFESFVMNLLRTHKDNREIQYHVICKANGSGFMDLKKLQGAVNVNDEEFTYCNAHCVLIPVHEKQAIFYDIKALKWVCEYIEKNHIYRPVVYILASRIGPFEKKYAERIHNVSGRVYQNPDGHEDWRGRWSLPVRKYWKYSERKAVKNADLVICDSRLIEDYIKDEYSEYQPKTAFISYGSYVEPSKMDDNDSVYKSWLMNHNLSDGEFYIVVGRCVPENNIESVVREFMLSNSKKDLAIITTENPRMLKDLENRLHYKADKRIKFVGTVYDQDLLKKIRENAFGYFHGHSVGGTNPSLLESLGSTKLNLLYDVSFNREVAEDAALYWNLDEGNLAKLIDVADGLSKEKIAELGSRAKKRIIDEYSWESICEKYRRVFEDLQ